jgi:hypothetical protein
VPTYERRPQFDRDYAALTQDQRQAFRAAVEKFVADLERGSFRSGLRVNGIKSAPGIFELTWAPNGRATFEYGAALRAGEPHIVWRRVGTHAVLDQA